MNDNTIEIGTWMQGLHSEIKAFHKGEQGLTTMEVLLLLFIAGITIYALSEGGMTIVNNVSQKVTQLLGLNMTWGSSR